MYLKDEPWMTSLMDKGDIIGCCANCNNIVREYEGTLNDCYAVYRGKCPHCGAINLLHCQKGAIRGYTSKEIFLELPTDHEILLNKWPDSPHIKCKCNHCIDG